MEPIIEVNDVSVRFRMVENLLSILESLLFGNGDRLCSCRCSCNCRKVNGEFVFEGEQVAIDLENDVQYVSMCPQCYFKARRAFYARKNGADR